MTVSGVSGGAGAVQLDPVQVQGMFPVPSQATIDNLPPPYAGGQVATGGQLGILGERGFMDTPFNQSNYTSQLIKDQQARSVMDVLANDSSVRNTLSSANYVAVPFVRGFTLSNQDYAFNGMYSVAPQMVVSPEYLERVELLKGPGVLLNGMPPFGSIGGVLNLVPKRAGDEPLNSVTATFASSAQVGGSVDFARRFGDDKQFGVRFNGVYRNGPTPVDRQSQEIGAAVMGMDFRGERAARLARLRLPEAALQRAAGLHLRRRRRAGAAGARRAQQLVPALDLHGLRRRLRRRQGRVRHRARLDDLRRRRRPQHAAGERARRRRHDHRFRPPTSPRRRSIGRPTPR